LVLKKQLSDARYAEQRAHELSRKFGLARIRHELKVKGIAEAVAQSVSAGDELERARAILCRKYRTPAASAEERAKRARFLQGRGFSTEVIWRLLRAEEGGY
jgi:regulatory protein